MSRRISQLISKLILDNRLASGLTYEPMADNDRGKNLREWRERRDLTQELLAARVVMSRATIQALENGRSKGNRGTWQRLADELGVDVGVLFAERSDPPENQTA